MSSRKGFIPGAAMLCLALAATVSACSSGPGNQNASDGSATSGIAKNISVKDGGKITYAADQEPTGFNSNNSKNIGASVINVVENVYPSVFNSAPDFNAHLNTNLMISAEQTTAEPQTIVYKIRPEAKWSDGTPIGFDDFDYLWRHRNGTVKEYDVASTTGYDQISTITGSDNGKTITVVFKKNFTEWQKLFSTIEGGGLVPAHYMKTLGDDITAWNTGLNKNLPVSGGPFKITNYQPGSSLTLSRNDAYYGPRSHLDEIVFRFLPNSDAQVAALQNGEVQLIYPQPQLDAVQKVQNIPNITSEITFGLSFEQLAFNTKNEFLKDVAVRKAIATALDTKAIIAKTVGQFSPKATTLGNRLWLTGQEQYEDHTPDAVKKAEGKAADAKALLLQAGYTLGPDNVLQKDNKPLALRFSTTAGNLLREQTGVLIQAQLKEAGIKIDIANLPSQKFFGEAMPQGNFDIAQFAWIGTPFPVAANQPIYACGGGSNFGKYCNPEVDQLFAAAQSELDPAKAATIVNKIDTILWADMATLPLYQKPTFIAYDGTFANIHDNSTKEGPFYNSGEWGTKE